MWTVVYRKQREIKIILGLLLNFSENFKLQGYIYLTSPFSKAYVFKSGDTELKETWKAQKERELNSQCTYWKESIGEENKIETLTVSVSLSSLFLCTAPAASSSLA